MLANPKRQVEAAALRDILDALQKAQTSNRPITADGIVAVVSFDRPKIAASLKELLGRVGPDALRRLNSERVSSKLGKTYRNPELLGRIDDTLRKLAGAANRRVFEVLGKKKVEVAGRLLRLHAPDFLSVVQKEDDENAHSDVIRWLLSPRHARAIAPPALAALVADFTDGAVWQANIRKAVDDETIAVRREYVFGREWQGSHELSRLDIFISGPGFALAIENKLWSSEHDEQTKTYWAWLSTLPKVTAGIFLTPDGDAPECTDFRALSYLGLLNALLEAPAHGKVPAGEELVLASYLKSLRASALRRELQMIERETS